MSDLISRSELYDQLANKLTWLMGYGDDLYLAVGSNIRDVIYNMPTAYDIDKVVEELEENSSRYTKKYLTPYGNNGYRDVKAISIHKAIEIVKQGGVGKMSAPVGFTPRYIAEGNIEAGYNYQCGVR